MTFGSLKIVFCCLVYTISSFLMDGNQWGKYGCKWVQYEEIWMQVGASIFKKKSLCTKTLTRNKKRENTHLVIVQFSESSDNKPRITYFYFHVIITIYCPNFNFDYQNKISFVSRSHYIQHTLVKKKTKYIQIVTSFLNSFVFLTTVSGFQFCSL